MLSYYKMHKCEHATFDFRKCFMVEFVYSKTDPYMSDQNHLLCYNSTEITYLSEKRLLHQLLCFQHSDTFAKLSKNTTQYL